MSWDEYEIFANRKTSEQKAELDRMRNRISELEAALSAENETCGELEVRRAALLRLVGDKNERIAQLEAALRRIADEDYEPAGESFTRAAAEIARAALEGKKP